MPAPFTIWCNDKFPMGAFEHLRRAVGLRHRILGPSGDDAVWSEAEIAVGQPSPISVLAAQHLRWVHLSAASFSAYDRDSVRLPLRERGTIVTTSSAVYADTCAQHALAMILTMNRGLLPAYRAQLMGEGWQQSAIRPGASVLEGETLLLLGFGSIGRKLTDLLAPFGARILVLQRKPPVVTGPIELIRIESLGRILPLADHVVNLLPLNEGTIRFMDKSRLGAMKKGAILYNIGRGGTVDEDALLEALGAGRIRCYLDVTGEEPLPASHPLWRAPDCYISPHIAGGTRDENPRLSNHFLSNLERFERGEALLNRVI